MSSSVGKNSAFLNLFWDLASDERSKRLTAANQIILHIQTCEAQGSSVDTDYTLKRLVRGLGSSRESARHGFVTCLSELLVTVRAIEVTSTLQLIDEHTKISGSLKGAEERDFLFGKLFGYLSLIRSGRLSEDVIQTGCVMDRLLELHARKGWLREVTTEAILTLLSAVSSAVVDSAGLLDKISPLLAQHGRPTPIQEMTAWQLMLAIGLQQYTRSLSSSSSASASASSSSKQKKHKHKDDGMNGGETATTTEGIIHQVAAMLPPEAQGQGLEPAQGQGLGMLSPDTLSMMSHTLLAATAGFPKVSYPHAYTYLSPLSTRALCPPSQLTLSTSLPSSVPCVALTHPLNPPSQLTFSTFHPSINSSPPLHPLPPFHPLPLPSPTNPPAAPSVGLCAQRRIRHGLRPSPAQRPTGLPLHPPGGLSHRFQWSPSHSIVRRRWCWCWC